MKINVKFLCVFIAVLFLVPAGAVLANNNIGDDNLYYGASGFYTLGLKGLGADYDVVDGFARGVSIKPVADRISKSRVLKSDSLQRVKPSNGNSNVLLDEVDQSQEQSDNFYKVYGDHWYAQSFIPGSDKSKLTKVEILINKHTKTKSLRVKTLSAGGKIFGKLIKPLQNNKLGSITLEIRETLDGRPIVDRTLRPDEIPKNGNGEWVVFDVPDIDLWIDHTYYIVVHASGGDENNYYRWYFAGNDPYGRGMGFSSYDNATTWNNEPNNDFCFRTYGELSDELPDGKTEYWALLVGVAKYEYGSFWKHVDNDAYDFRDVLIHHGWQNDHIVVLTNEQATEKNITDALRWIDSMEDEDDLVIYFHAAHGSDHYICTYEYYGGFMSYELDAMLHWLGSKNILAIIECCYSGGFISALKFTNRIILTSSRATEYSISNSYIENGVFAYFLADETGTCSKQFGWPTPLEGKDGAFARKSCDTNNDGWVSAEEAYTYAAPYTAKFAWEHYEYGRVNQHPQIYDGYPGELKITKI